MSINGGYGYPEKEVEKNHNVTIDNRGSLFVSGVLDVIGFDEVLVEVNTVCGVMIIEGEGMKVSVVDVEKGCLTLGGRINSLYYSEKKAKNSKGMFGKKNQ